MLTDLKKNRRRIFRAALASMLGISMTVGWYKLGEVRSKSIGRKKVATLVKAVNEVHRRPEKRVIWESIEENEDLYVGEAIRTTEVSEASIRFVGSGTQIELEPDSLIVFEESSGSLALNFLKGNLFVSQTGQGDGSDVQINAGNKSITAEEFKKTGGVISAVQEKGPPPLKILSPEPHKPLYVNPTIEEKISFNFEKLEPGYDVRLEVGPNPKKLKPVAGATGPGETGSLKVPVKIGSFYWRLVARSLDGTKPEKTSAIQKNEAVAKVAPTLLQPANEELVVWDSEEPKTRFTWSNTARLENVAFELSRSADFKLVLASQSASEGTSLAYEFTEPGKYFWRVRGSMRGTKEQLTSSVSAFTFQKELKLLAPKLIKPAANEHMSHQLLLTSKLALTWEKVPGVENFKVIVHVLKTAKAPNGGEDLIQQTKTTELRMTGLEPGTYSWTVVALDKNGNESPAAIERKFFVDMLPKINWADNQETMLNHFYVTEKPSLRIDWQPGQAKQWRVRVVDDGKASSDVKWSQPIKEAKWTQDVAKNGKYEVEVEGFNEKDEIVAKSGRRMVNVQDLPLLPAPQFADNVPDKLMARNNGSMQVGWKPVPKASRYVVEVKKEDGTTVKEMLSDRTEGGFTSLMPGQYKVTVKSVDQNGRRGPASESRPLLVPDRSDARAPKIKAIKVK
jgi:hypothetical protein